MLLILDLPKVSFNKVLYPLSYGDNYRNIYMLRVQVSLYL